MKVIFDSNDINFLQDSKHYLPFDLFKIKDKYFVSWRRFSPCIFKRGFFDEQIQVEISKNSNGVVTPIETFLLFSDQNLIKRNLKLIFHTSRCGSTLFMNVLNTFKNHLVLQEPNILNKFTLDVWTDKTIELYIKKKLLLGIINVFLNYSKNIKSKLFIRLTSYNLFLIDHILECLKYPKSICLTRDFNSSLNSLKNSSNNFLVKSTCEKLKSIYPYKKNLIGLNRNILNCSDYLFLLYSSLELCKKLTPIYYYEDLFQSNQKLDHLLKVLSYLQVSLEERDIHKIQIELEYYSKDKLRITKFLK